MPKFKITYGLTREEIIEAETLGEAKEIAYASAMEIANSWLDYTAEPVEDEEN